MNNYNPGFALILFFIISGLLFLLFRPTNGWFWIVKNYYKKDEKTIIEDILKLLYNNEDSGKQLDVKNITAALKYSNKYIVE
ncbi:MAG: hypothetical protein P8X62_08800, partial [Flavobacteriaceae bacterium]